MPREQRKRSVTLSAGLTLTDAAAPALVAKTHFLAPTPNRLPRSYACPRRSSWSLRSRRNGQSSTCAVDNSRTLIAQPDTRAYFKSIQDRILELEALGMGAGEEFEDEEGDERAQLIRGSLQQLSGHEIELAVDAESAIVLERLTHSMDDFARRVLADRFAGQYAALAKHPFASHVIQTLFTVAVKTIEREVRRSGRRHG